jgi:hypothetical protein
MDQVELRLAALRKEHLVRVADRDLMAVDQQELSVAVRHGPMLAPWREEDFTAALRLAWPGRRVSAISARSPE